MKKYGPVGDLGEFSDRVAMKDAQAVSIQEPISIDRRNLMTHTGRLTLSSTSARLAGNQELSNPVVVTKLLIKLVTLVQ